MNGVCGVHYMIVNKGSHGDGDGALRSDLYTFSLHTYPLQSFS